MARDKDTWRKNILAKLDEAGRAGTTKTALGVRKTGPARLALDEFIREGKVVCLGSNTQNLLFKKGLEPNRESVREELRTVLRAIAARLFTAEELSKKLRNPRKGQLIRQIIPQMTKVGELYEFSRGSTSYFVFLESMDRERGMTEKASSDVNGADIRKAYQALVTETGYTAVHISALSERSGCDLDNLKTFLLAEAKDNRVALSEGDWSVSSEFVRRGVIPFRGKKLLQVRFK